LPRYKNREHEETAQAIPEAGITLRPDFTTGLKVIV